MICFDDWNEDDKYSSSESEIERILEQHYSNPIEEDVVYVVCPSCGEKLYDRDFWYPKLGLCEYCLPDYREKIDIE